MTLELVKTRTREQFQEELYISYSQLNTYLICPMKYAHNYVYGTPWETKPAALAFGSAIHKAAEHFYSMLKDTGEIVPAEDIIDVFTQVLDQEFQNSEVKWSFKKGDDFDAIRKQGIELAKLFHTEAAPQKIMAVELPFFITIPDVINGQGNLPVKLAGVMDLVESDQDGVYCVVELKTSAQRFSNLRLEYDLQATAYSYAMQRMGLSTSGNSTLIRYDVLLKTKKPAFERYFVTRTEADHQRLIELINLINRAIEQRIFYRQTGWQCADCQFKKTCFN